MKYSVATIFALAAAVIATPAPGNHGNNNNNNLQHVYCTDQSETIIVDVEIDITLTNNIRQCNRNEDWGKGRGWNVRQSSDNFCKRNKRVHGVWGCSQPCSGRIDYNHCTRCDSGRW